MPLPFVLVPKCPSPRAPLASQECDLSPVTSSFLARHHQYNSSYRLATLQPATPRALPRTSTRLSLARPHPPPKPELEPVYTLAGPGPLRRYPAPRPEPSLYRGGQGRASSHSATTVDSGVYSLPPTHRREPPPPSAALPVFQLLGLLLPPASRSAHCCRRRLQNPHVPRRKLQLLLKFILKISMNCELSLDSSQSNASLCLDTFLAVVLR